MRRTSAIQWKALTYCSLLIDCRALLPSVCVCSVYVDAATGRSASHQQQCLLVDTKQNNRVYHKTKGEREKLMLLLLGVVMVSRKMSDKVGITHTHSKSAGC